MKEAVEIINGAGLQYDEININCGCPAESATAGTYGVVLMQQPEVVNNDTTTINHFSW
jgi:tRNA-dihydrouridine synthase